MSFPRHYGNLVSVAGTLAGTLAGDSQLGRLECGCVKVKELGSSATPLVYVLVECTAVVVVEFGSRFDDVLVCSGTCF